MTMRAGGGCGSICRDSGSVVTWRRAQVALLSAQGMPVAKTAEVSFTSADRARDVLHNFNGDGDVIPEPGGPEAVLCLDEFGSLDLQPHPGRQWTEHDGRHKGPDREPRPRRRTTCIRPHGVRHLFAAHGPARHGTARDRLYRHVKNSKHCSKFLEFSRSLRSLYPPEVRIAIVCDSHSPHLTTKRCHRVVDRAGASTVEVAHTPINAPWLNRIDARFTALRYFAIAGTDHAGHKEQSSTIRRYIHPAEQARSRRTPPLCRRASQRRTGTAASFTVTSLTPVPWVPGRVDRRSETGSSRRAATTAGRPRSGRGTSHRRHHHGREPGKSRAGTRPGPTMHCVGGA
ncbi:hypothetical protein GCM10010406_55710 [Streptomyces thermolineatus]|uniref:Tc1-like transposase DDE domain-containing protein n=1 Tax=Streptomyces thermolineatus TaxID=44033 RepID=A0ABN3N1B3_9ACTN